MTDMVGVVVKGSGGVGGEVRCSAMVRMSSAPVNIDFVWKGTTQLDLELVKQKC